MPFFYYYSTATMSIECIKLKINVNTSFNITYQWVGGLVLAQSSFNISILIPPHEDLLIHLITWVYLDETKQSQSNRNYNLKGLHGIDHGRWVIYDSYPLPSISFMVITLLIYPLPMSHIQVWPICCTTTPNRADLAPIGNVPWCLCKYIYMKW